MRISIILILTAFLFFIGCAANANGGKVRLPKDIARLAADGKYEEAQTRVEQLLISPKTARADSIRLMLVLGKLLTAQKKWDEAISAYDWLEKNSPLDKIHYRQVIKVLAKPERQASIEHLPQTINSPYGEINPIISTDGKALYFIVDDGMDQDIFVSQMDDAGNWLQRKNIGKPLNTEFSDGLLSVMPGGNTFLVNSIYNIDGTKEMGFSLSHDMGESWSFPEPVKIANLYNRNRYTSACLAADGKTLLLALERDGGYGDLDIYVSFMRDDGVFTAPKNLGPNVNTMGTDGTPFLAPDGKTMYFSSDGHPSLGDADIFFTRRLDSTWTNWSMPENLGKELNTIGWDAYYTVSADGDYVYFVSSRKPSLGSTDIFRAQLPEEAKPKPVITVEGTVTDVKSTPVGANISYSRLSDEKVEGIASSNPLTGHYSIVLPVGEHYGFSIHKEGYLFYSDNIDATKIDETTTITRDITLKPVEIGSQIVLKNIFFDFNKTELLPESIGELNRLLQLMKDNPRIRVEIAGHTDSIGSDDYNAKLSTARAQAVAAWLVERGIDTARISAKGYGKTKPIATNDTEDGRSQNRRVTFTVVGMN